MQQFTIFSTVMATLAVGSNAAAIGSRDSAITQFRLYSGTDCSTGNEGFAQAFAEDLDTCKPLTDFSVRSVNVELVQSGCTVYLYDDEACSAGRRALPVGECQVNENQAPWLGYTVSCATSATGN